MSARETVAMVFLLLGAGTETTTHLISGSVYELVRNSAVRVTGSHRIGWRTPGALRDRQPNVLAVCC